MRMLITGFGPFPGVPHNPTRDLVHWLAEETQPHRKGVEGIMEVLPVEWETGAMRLRDLLRKHDPHVVLQFGASRRAAGFHIEQVARNRASFLPDVKGERASGREILPGAPRSLRASLPSAPLAIHLQKLGLPALVSSDAGSYLCNALYFHALDWSRQASHAPICQFVHVPAVLGADSPASETLARADLRRGALALIDSLAAAARRRERSAAMRAAG